MLNKKIIILLCCIITLNGYATVKKQVQLQQAGVLITFDDDYVDEWFKADKILAKYKWKATFYLTKPQLYTKKQFRQLRKLKSKGHELGAHGFNHFNALTFYTNNSFSIYLKNEIEQTAQLLKKKRIKTNSFSYPFGAHNIATDSLLLKNFTSLRTTTYGKQAPEKQQCYYKNDAILQGLGIDNHYPHFDISYFLSLLQYAKENNKIVIFYVHKPVLEAKNTLEIEHKTLISICEYVQKNNLKFYTPNDLIRIKK